MKVDLILKGFATGALIGSPIGPVGLLCLRNTIKDGKKYGLYSGLGAASADAFFALILSLGMSFVSTLVAEYSSWLRIISGAFVCYIGFLFFMTKPSVRNISYKWCGLAGAYISAFLLSFLNPATILTMLAVLTLFGVSYDTYDYICIIEIVIGVFLGSATWWFLFAGKFDVSRLTHDLNRPYIALVRKLAGACIMATGAALLLVNLISLI